MNSHQRRKRRRERAKFWAMVEKMHAGIKSEPEKMPQVYWREIPKDHSVPDKNSP